MCNWCQFVHWLVCIISKWQSNNQGALYANLSNIDMICAFAFHLYFQLMLWHCNNAMFLNRLSVNWFWELNLWTMASIYYPTSSYLVSIYIDLYANWTAYILTCMQNRQHVWILGRIYRHVYKLGSTTKFQINGRHITKFRSQITSI